MGGGLDNFLAVKLHSVSRRETYKRGLHCSRPPRGTHCTVAPCRIEARAGGYNSQTSLPNEKTRRSSARARPAGPPHARARRRRQPRCRRTRGLTVSAADPCPTPLLPSARPEPHSRSVASLCKLCLLSLCITRRRERSARPRLHFVSRLRRRARSARGGTSWARLAESLSSHGCWGRSC